MGTKATRIGQNPGYTYWSMFCKSENMLPSKMLANTPDDQLGMLSRLKNCPQDPEWHPEGNVWTHTQQVCDMMLAICRDDDVTEAEQQTLMLAALLHDNAKPETTFVKWRDGVPRIVAPGHAEKGAPRARQWLLEQGFPEAFTERVAALVKCHMRHLNFRPTEGDHYAHLFALVREVQPGNLFLLAKLVEADISGRVANPISLTRRCIQHVEVMVNLARECNVLHGIHAKSS